ncbi:hypothetical protein ACHHYP_09652 [Achlya hypogyna]|uniref:Secreted protein n=1 Tax=Achlya hypogyna TaxID=1202772 RepID=A0A0A7CNY4_ACHHY|nr:secreted protein [Achlya hypogyna]OQR87014.1 hypothetical protein ACHHYP_09652 [Achlya hypogyna]
MSTVLSVLTLPCLCAQIVAFQHGISAALHHHFLLWRRKELPAIVYFVPRTDPKSFLHHLVAAASPTALELVAEAIRWKPQWLTGLAIDVAAAHGQVEALLLLQQYPSLVCSHRAMDSAAANGHLRAVRFLHQFRSEGCTVSAMDDAAAHGHLHIVNFLHQHRSEGCTTAAVDRAAAAGHLRVVQFLLRHRSEGCTPQAMEGAAAHGHWHVVAYLQQTLYYVSR